MALPIVRAMQIAGSTRLFMILGDPVVQVKAPALFNPLFARHGVDAVLVPVQVPSAQVQGYVRQAFAARNLGGLLLTIPHKTPVFRMLERCDRLGTVAQSVNAVRLGADGQLEGGLFDGIGFVKGLHRFGIPVRGARTMVVGVGGAGAAIAASLADEGAAEIALVDLDPAACEGFAQRLRATWPATVSIHGDADPTGFDLVVNATPLGLRPDDPLPFDPARLDRGAAVVDILMKDHPTPLLRACAAQGVRAWPGLEMMIQQAPDYLDFFGLHTLAEVLRHDDDEVRAALQAAVPA